MMNTYELMGSKSSPLCHEMFDSDKFLASDSNEDSNDDHSGSGGGSKYEKYHDLDHLDSYDTVMDLENNLINCHPSALQSSHTTNGLSNDNHNQSQHLSQQNLNLNNNHLISNNNCNKRKTTADGTAANGLTNGAPKRVPPPNGKKTKGRVKIKMEFIDNKLRRYTTFSKRKTGIMKKAYELSTLTGTQVMLLVASETGHVYTFATRKLQPMITSDAGKALIQTCLNSPDPNGLMSGDQRMSATGFEETDLTYAVGDESINDKSDESCDQPSGQCGSSGDSSEEGTDSPELLSGVMMSNGSASATTYAQLENALPLNYLTEANLISSKLANRQLLSQLTNANVLSTSSSLSHTSHSSSSSSVSSPSLITCSSIGGQSSPVNSGTKNGSKQQFLGTKQNSIHNTIQALPPISQTSAQQLLSAGNLIFCSNGQQLTLPSVSQSSQSSPSTSTPTLMYNPTQGLVYATSGTGSAGSLLADGLILNLGQNHSTGAEFLINNINNSAFSQIQLQQPKPSTTISGVNQTGGALKRQTQESGTKKQRTK